MSISKPMVTTIISIIFISSVVAQSAPSYLSNTWSWIGGSPSISNLGIYGNMNRTSVASVPGSRQLSAIWLDSDENLWVFGGVGHTTSTSTTGKLGDVWFYDRQTTYWTWKSGSNTMDYNPAPPSSAGQTGLTLFPSARDKAFFWHDKTNKVVYIFGGKIASDMRVNDMWKFNYVTLEWTYLGGTTLSSQIGTETWPSARFHGGMWIDSTGSLWMFGGWGVQSDGSEWFLNDLWVYTPVDNSWSKFIATDLPQVRHTPTSFIDTRDDTIYLFGGNTVGNDHCNELHRLDKVARAWVKLGGTCPYAIPSYGNYREFAPTNIPGGRLGGAGAYYAGYLWLFGGFGIRGGYRTQLDDLWAYDIARGQWAWISGNSTSGSTVATIYPPYVTEASLGGREVASAVMSDQNMILFGGYGLTTAQYSFMGLFNDVWHTRILRDECSLGIDDCNSLASCIDEDNGYSCDCSRGYTGTGHGVDGCADLDECSTGHLCNEFALCENTVGNYTCTCPNGFEGDGYGVFGCVDVDECATNLVTCTGLAVCNNTIGGYLCTCPAGYTPNGENGCDPASGPGAAPQARTPDGNIIAEPSSDGAPLAEAESNVIGIAVGVSIGGAAAVAGAVLLVLFLRQKKKRGVSIEKAMKSLDTDDDRFNIPYSELVFKRELGAGSFGKVFLGTWRKAEVALKLATLSTWEDFANEVKLTVYVFDAPRFRPSADPSDSDMPPHPNVVQVFGISRNGPHPVLILEFCDGGSLDKMLYDSNYALSIAQTMEIVHGVAKGMLHLHKNNIIHRDLAARNILLAAGRPKISDFGLARVLDGQSQSGHTKSNVGPLRWMSPESLQTSTYSTQSDVWAFGIVVYEIVARQEPHTEEDAMSIGYRIRDQGLVPTIPADCDPFLRDLMIACWHSDPNKRPTFEQICELIQNKVGGGSDLKFVPSVTPSGSNESTATHYSSVPASRQFVSSS